MQRISRAVLLGLVASVLLALGPAGVRAAQVWHVDGSVGASGDGTSWAAAFKTLQEGLAAAASGDEIWVAAGTYLPADDGDRNKSFGLVAGVALYGGFAGGEVTRDARDWVANETILSGDLGVNGDPLDNSYHVVTGASDTALDGFTVTGGYADGSDPEDHGGGMFSLDVTGLTVTNCVFVGNYADGDGGALFNDDVDGLAISDCVFSDNDSGAYSGAIHNYSCSTITIADSEFTGNTCSSSGGAMRNLHSSIVLTNCLFADNVAVGGSGGAVDIISAWDTVFHGCRFMRNTAEQDGGAMHNYGDAIEITNCLFFANVALEAGSRGGATFNSGILRFTSCTFSGNSADEGGAIYNARALATITNCILWGNTAIDGLDIYDDEDSASIATWNCMEQGGFAGEGRNFSVDPLFVDAVGGDLRLQQGSPCIDAADGDAAPPLDIDGDPRHDDSGMANRGSGAVTFADFGVFEFQGDTTGSWLSLLAPTQAYTFRVGSELDINWEATSDISDIKVELSRNGGPWVALVTATANDGEYVWTVDDGGQGLPQTDCAVRVSDAADGIPSSTSTTFGIFAGVWYVDIDATGGDGLTWSSALSGPGDALARARAGDQIWIAEGTYKPTSDGDQSVSFDLLDGVRLYGGFPGTPGTEGDFGSRDADVFVTVLSGDIGVEGDNTDNSYHVIVGASNVTMDGFTVAGGYAYGGGFRCYGGGIYNGLYRATSGVVLTDCTFTDNNAWTGGGAMYNTNVDDMTITDCIFTGNSADDGGGAMYSYYGSQVITDCTFSDNSAGEHGGAMLIGEISLEIADCTLVNNTAVDWGGAIYNNRSPAVVTACAFLGNSADVGGGMMNQICLPLITNCVFAGNSAGYRGGGVANYWNAHTEFVNCSLAGNVAGTEGGGICNFSASPTLTNCILWSNAAPDGPEIRDIGGVTMVSYSCVGQPGYAGTSGNIDSDPLFFDADGADDVAGTLDDDLHVQAGSPCIDAADGDAAPDVDIDGLLRYDDPGRPNTGTGTPDYADMGAYESGGSPTGTVTGTVILEDGADPAQINITAGGQTASTSVVSDTIEYTIYNVPGITVEVNVETTETGYLATGSPATITWVGTEGSAANTTVTTHGTVLGAVVLEDGADGALVTATAGGQTAITAVGAGTMDYTISNVPLVTAEGTVGTTEAGYEAIGSPAAINWIDADGTMAFTTVRVIRGTVTGQVTLINNPDPALVTIIAGGQTAVKTPGAGVIDYSISNVPVVTAEVTVSTTQPSCTVTGSPAIIAWAGPSGAATDVTVTAPAIIEEDGCTPGRGSFGAWLVPVALLLSVLTMRRKREAAA